MIQSDLGEVSTIKIEKKIEQGSSSTAKTNTHHGKLAPSFLDDPKWKNWFLGHCCEWSQQLDIVSLTRKAHTHAILHVQIYRIHFTNSVDKPSPKRNVAEEIWSSWRMSAANVPSEINGRWWWSQLMRSWWEICVLRPFFGLHLLARFVIDVVNFGSFTRF